MSTSTPVLTIEQEKFWNLLLTRVTSSYTYTNKKGETLQAGQPYLAYMFYSLIPVYAPDTPTMAVDVKGRCYVNFDRYLDENDPYGGLDHATAALNHEVWHLLRDHHKRYDKYSELHPQVDAKQWNIAADLTINQDIDTHMPKGVYLMPGEGQMAKIKKGLTTEEYYSLVGGEGKKSEQNGAGDSSKEKDEGSSEENESNTDGSSEKEESNTDESSEENESNTDGFPEEEKENTEDSEGEGSNKGQESGGDPNSSPSCGSGAGGNPEEWELGESEAPGLGEGRVEEIRQVVAEKIMELADRKPGMPGSAPGGLLVWAEETLRGPEPDWRKKLQSNVRKGIASSRGYVDYQYKRPSRRNQNRELILPSLRAPKSKIGIGIDISRSNLHNLPIVVQNTVSIAKKAGVRGKDLIAFGVDVRVEATKFVNDPLRVLETLKGGGGTNMIVAFDVFDELYAQKKIDIAILMTDLETAWPVTPRRTGLKYIVLGLTAEGKKRSNVYVSRAEKALAGWADLVIVDTSEWRN